MAGKPGKITAEIVIQALKPKNEDFVVSESFMKYKKNILEKLKS
jgi:hypothetical protein